MISGLINILEINGWMDLEILIKKLVYFFVYVYICMID